MIVHIRYTWKESLLRASAILLTVAGLVLLGIWGAAQLSERYYQARAERSLEEQMRQQRAQSESRSQTMTPPVPSEEIPQPKPGARGTAVGRLEIPRLGVSVMVLEGDDDQTLSRGAGRIPGTALPGTPGNIGIAAHRDTFFRPLASIKPGDRIVLTTPENGTQTYTVEWHRVVDPDETTVLARTETNSLTLVTCYPFHYVGPAPQRWIVRAHAVERAETSKPNNGLLSEGEGKCPQRRCQG